MSISSRESLKASAHQTRMSLYSPGRIVLACMYQVWRGTDSLSERPQDRASHIAKNDDELLGGSGASMGITFCGCDCDGKSREGLKVSCVSRRVVFRLSPLFLGGSWGKDGCRGGTEGAIGVSCGEASDCQVGFRFHRLSRICTESLLIDGKI
jgi:hypothetical protein